MKPATNKQIYFLRKLGAKQDELQDLDIFKASQLIKYYLSKQNDKRQDQKLNNNYSKELNALIDSQKDLKEEFAKMVNNDKYYLENSSFYAKINGVLVVFEKPSIETHFCFGYGYCGVSTEEDRKAAEGARHIAATNEEYFISENLESYNKMIEALKEQKTNKFSASYSYGYWLYGLTKNYAYNFYRLSVVKDGYGNLDSNFITIDENIDLIIEILQYEKAKFEKRLNTYLKRYGLSKLHTWTYLSD